MIKTYAKAPFSNPVAAAEAVAATSSNTGMSAGTSGGANRLAVVPRRSSKGTADIEAQDNLPGDPEDQGPQIESLRKKLWPAP